MRRFGDHSSHPNTPKCRKIVALVVMLCGLTLVTTGCSDGSDTLAEPQRYTVTVTDMTLVDETRSTPETGAIPALPMRTLETSVFIPEGNRKFPLLIFSHGLGATPQVYAGLIEELAAAGFVVVAPTFPLTSQFAPAGPDPADTQQQAGDVSFLIDAVEAAVNRDEAPFAQRVDLQRIGTLGHSNGAITTLGVVANSCCRDTRIDAAVSLAGAASPFNGGDYDFSTTPPLFIVHGTADVLVPYEGSVQIFNSVEAPKGIVTLNDVDHSSFVAPSGTGFETTRNTVIDFFRAHLRGDSDAHSRLIAEQVYDIEAEMRYAASGGTTAALPLPPPITNRVAAVEPNSNLVDGQIVTVTWRNFMMGRVVNIVQCSEGGLGGSEVCDFTHAYVLHPNPEGEGSLPLQVITGDVGSGRCDAKNNDCVIVVNDSSLTTEDAILRIPISFAP